MGNTEANNTHPFLPRVRGTTKRALITGITGQDGSYLAELLLEKGYEVHGIVRRSSSFNTERIDHLYHDPHEPGVRLFTALRRPRRLGRAGQAALRAPARRGLQPRRPEPRPGLVRHARVHGRRHRRRHAAPARGDPRGRRRARASTRRPRPRCSASAPPPQNEETPFHPRSPYGVAKVAAYWVTVNYREAYGMFAVNGILFNHESPRRGETFVTRKITRAVGADQGRAAGEALPRQPRRQARLGLRPRLRRGDVADAPAGRARRLRDRHRRDAQRCASSSRSPSLALGLDLDEHVEIDPRYFRPTEVDVLLGDATKARELLGWEPKVRSRSWSRSWSTPTSPRSRTSWPGKSRVTATRSPEPCGLPRRER